jgi:hypothetical protein
VPLAHPGAQAPQCPVPLQQGRHLLVGALDDPAQTQVPDLSGARLDVVEPLGAAAALRLYALYFGGTAFGIGSIIYQLRCPAEVKEHGTAWAFVAREGDLIDAHRLHAFKLALIEARYGAYLRRLNCPVGKYHEPIDRYGQMLLARDLADADREFIAICDRFVENLDRDVKRWGKTSELMADYFVSLRRARPGSRMAVVASYAVGFVLLAYPTLDVFGRVVRQFTIFVSSAVGLTG